MIEMSTGSRPGRGEMVTVAPDDSRGKIAVEEQGSLSTSSARVVCHRKFPEAALGRKPAIMNHLRSLCQLLSPSINQKFF